MSEMNDTNPNSWNIIGRTPDEAIDNKLLGTNTRSTNCEEDTSCMKRDGSRYSSADRNC